jgi:hypothetical protein
MRKGKEIKFGRFVIVPDYESMHGTGRTCQTVQGYQIRHGDPDRQAPVLRWYGSQREARLDIGKWVRLATDTGVDELAQLSRSFLRRLADAFPESERAPAALAAIDRRERDEKAVLQRATDVADDAISVLRAKGVEARKLHSGSTCVVIPVEAIPALMALIGIE